MDLEESCAAYFTMTFASLTSCSSLEILGAFTPRTSFPRQQKCALVMSLSRST
ncbi:hypothetical protein KC19_VG063800 [Ceratodon purpureus]|uniref:Uncharacterized protein n=1 Tax=Ceratodon purpureus TaxID=3225 RepID=A0A8T0HMK0_CERPU|nr:hypothetical protein KC19_VG063800 [Ceratodon purpureus]